MSGFEVAVVLIPSIVLIVGGIYFIYWGIENEFCDIQMKFNYFRTLFYIAPDKWDIDDLPIYNGVGDFGRTRIGFNAIDYLRWLTFRRHIKSSRKKSIDIRTQQELLKSFQEDISRYKISAANFVNSEFEKLKREQSKDR